MTNATSDRIIISDASFRAIVPLCHELKRDTKLILLQEPNQLQMPDHVSHMFLYNPSDRLLSAFKQPHREANLIYQFRDPMTHLVVSLYAAKSDSNPI